MQNQQRIQHADSDKPDASPKFVISALPRLRRNKRLENKWGQKYYTTLNEAVFMQQSIPYMPAEPPASLQNEADDCHPLYVCTQCNDCFRFSSSFDAHNSRRSWVLGYWCQNCFMTDCCHMKSGQQPCFDCQTANRQRKTFLRAKGLGKGRKVGAIKIFYNQCQFFAHLKAHQTSVVDIGDIMLMPIPTDIDEPQYTELERLCEIIMEHMFVTRTHIMDWLQTNELGNKWWRLLQSKLENNDNSVAELLGIHGNKKVGRLFVKRPKKTTCAPKSIFSSISDTIESVIAQSTCSETPPPTESENSRNSPISPVLIDNAEQHVENDDSPCTTTDIAFVDCGPSAKTYPPDVAILLPPKDKLTIIPNGSTSCSKVTNLTPVSTNSHQSVQGPEIPLKMKNCDASNVISSKLSSSTSEFNQQVFEPKISVKKFAQERSRDPSVIICSKNSTISVLPKPQIPKKLVPALNIKLPIAKTPLSGREITRAIESSKKAVAQASVSTSGSKILTVHTPKNADLSDIIGQLPPEVINGKKLVFIGQGAASFTMLPQNELISSLGMIKISSELDKQKIIQSVPAMSVSSTSNQQSVLSTSESVKKNLPTEKAKPKLSQTYADGQIVYKNGKKFVIRHARKSISGPTYHNLNNVKFQTIPKHVSLSAFLSQSEHPLTSYIPIAPKSDEQCVQKAAPLSIPLPCNSPDSSSSSSPPRNASALLSTSQNSKGVIYEAQVKQKNSDMPKREKSPGSRNSFEPQSLISIPVDVPQVDVVNDIHTVQYLSMETDTNGKIYIDFSKKMTRPVKINEGLTRGQGAINYSTLQRIFKEQLRYHGEQRIKQQIKHLIQVNSEYSKTIGDTNGVSILNNLVAIERLENALKEYSLRPETGQSSNDHIIELLANSNFEEPEAPTICPTCNKPKKSHSNFVAFSESISRNPDICHCDNYICYICNVFQGNMSRFIAHLNYHAKQKPYQCPECFRKFATFSRLKAHTWTACFHVLAKRWFKCKVCQFEGFLDMESITKHYILAHSKLKIACPECGLLFDSHALFVEHCKADHPNVPNHLRPVNLVECNVGNCLVSLEHYRSHLEDHDGIVKILYYQCPFCPFPFKDRQRGREIIKRHLRTCHRTQHDQLSDLVSSECLLDAMFPSVSTKLKSNTEQIHQDEQTIEFDQCSNASDVMQTNIDTLSQDSIESNSEANNQPSSDYLNTTVTKQELKNGVKCSIWSINLAHPQLETVDNRNNVISEYSSSPKIFDVRSVTPDSYAELGEATKEKRDINTDEKDTNPGPISDLCMSEEVSENVIVTEDVDRSEQSSNVEVVSNHALPKIVEHQILPSKLPQLILIKETGTNVNMTKMNQSTVAALNAIVKLSHQNRSSQSLVTGETALKLTELETEPTDEKTDAREKNKSTVPVIKISNTIVCTSGAEQLKRPTQGKQTMAVKTRNLPVSVLKSKSADIRIVENVTDCETNNQLSNSGTDGNDVLQIINCTSGTGKEGTKSISFFHDVPKLPPLARIPQHLLVTSQQNVEVTNPQCTKDAAGKFSTKLKQKRRQLWRIALNAPTDTSESVIYCCHLCGELINTSWSVIAKHFDSRHSEDYKLAIVTPRLLRMSDDFISKGYKELLGPRKRKTDANSPTSKRRRRWNPRKHIEKDLLDLGLCIEQESVQDGEGNFVCKKCDQRCNDISSLRKHIGTNHRIKDHYLVCLECGENFVVEPSLQMHLKAFHRIQDPTTYLAQNTAYAKEVTEAIESEPNTGTANQCHVCMAVFEDKPAVDKHLRVHGMAFLNRKRIEARIAARNPEKKFKMENPEDVSAVTVSKGETLENHKPGATESVDETVHQLSKSDIEEKTGKKALS
ncbi:uncharacterized protein [Neodiprion pinetum]|uniref:uncharacterized protein isoform X1 n=2 Tax=Neodiprion pinetum TaxID=441929 RepID=UPI001EDDD41C|nr:uncharacterized protein LOC124214106 isoform X1 [Neodiprion pinetum]